MVVKYQVARLFRDDKTRLFVPNLAITATDAITNIASSYVTAPYSNQGGFFPSKFEDVDFKDASLMSSITGIIDSLTIGLGVTKIETSQEYTMPLSKGIGSTGEVIHLLGSKNEIINLEFKTDNYPGRLGFILRSLLQKILETTQVVYLIDDLFLATPCLIRKSKISKEGNYRGAIMGQMELISLTTGGSWIDDKLGDASSIISTAKKLKLGIKTAVNSDALRNGVAAVGVVALSGLLVYSAVNS